MTTSTRHQWGSAPSGSSKHDSVCRRCGLEEITDWYVVPGGRAVEITTWVAPTGAVLGALPVDSHQAPPRWQALEILETVADPPPRELLVWCPGDPRAWERAG